MYKRSRFRREDRMAPRAIATATVSFGMVSIPVKLYSAAETSASVSFNLLHKKCNTRLKQQYVCPRDEEIVTRDQMVKGYEFAKDQFVPFTPEELKALEEKGTQTVEIAEFVPAALVDPIYYDKPYFLGPDKGGDRAYLLLARAMRESGRAALARYAARGKQYLVMLRPTKDDRVVMQQLHYADEVRSSSEVPAGSVDVKPQELKLAMQLIDQISSDTFKPEDYEDDVKKRMLEAIAEKVDGKEISLAPTETHGAQVIDLMEALKASLQKKGAASAPAKPTLTAVPKESRKPPKQAAERPKTARKSARS
jgi:DNA end-binding protein Ku